MRIRRTLVILLCLLGSGFAQEHHRSTLDSLKRLDSEERAARMQVFRVVETLKLTAGQLVADIGAGSGLFSRRIARQVGDKGVVFAVDIDAEALKYIDETAQQQGLSNVRTVSATEDDPKIPKAVDLIVIIDTLHHVPDLPTYVKNLRRYLRPDGRICIIDFTEKWPAAFEKRKYSVSDLDVWMRAAGLSRVEKHDFLENHFLAIYR
jgi:cyclopropane fatty-acyl-phospholipid synthase-like methyltransferase